MESKIQKNCYHCLHIRPKKNNRCVIKQIVIQNIHTYCCNDFLLDIYVTKDEKKIDEPYKQKKPLFRGFFIF